MAQVSGQTSGQTKAPSAESTPAERLAWLEERNRQLEAQNQALRDAKPIGKITLKIGEKKGLSVYGLGRFPVTLYKSQWLRLLAEHERIAKFIAENGAQLAERD